MLLGIAATTTPRSWPLAASDGASVASAHSGQQDADAGPGGCQRGMRIVPDPASAADIALGLRRFRPSRRAEETLSMCLR
jgi:hypothetical protein